MAMLADLGVPNALTRWQETIAERPGPYGYNLPSYVNGGDNSDGHDIGMCYSHVPRGQTRP